MKVGSWLFIDFMGVAVARGIHIFVSEVCADTLRDGGYLAVHRLKAAGGNLYFIYHSYLSRGEDGRGNMVVGETEHALLVSSQRYISAGCPI